LVWFIEQLVSSEVIFTLKPFSKIFLVCAFFAAIFVANLNAQPADATNATVTIAATHAEAPAQIVPAIAPVLFHIGPLPVTNSMVCTWIVALLILGIVRLSTWTVKEIPTGMQNAIEALCEAWEDLAGGVLEPRVARWVFPFATTFFIFAVLSNLVDLIPGVGSIGYGVADKASSLPFAVSEIGKPFFRPPTSDANLTFAMASIFFVMSLFWALRYNGLLGLVKHVFGVKVEASKIAYVPLLLLFIFIGIMESFSILFIRPVALALRLYGNIFGGETMLSMALAQKSFLMAVLFSLPGYFFETIVCILQAFVFAMLTIAFVGTLCTPADEHGH
jgi:F-type H+-transporting ATPase subunit a